MRPKAAGDSLMSLMSLMSRFTIAWKLEDDVSLVEKARAAAAAYVAANPAAITKPVTRPNPDTERRRALVVAILAEHPDRRIAIVAEPEPGNPAHVMVAIRNGWSGEITIAADRYDPFALLELLARYALMDQQNATQH